MGKFESVQPGFENVILRKQLVGSLQGFLKKHQHLKFFELFKN